MVRSLSATMTLCPGRVSVRLIMKGDLVCVQLGHKQSFPNQAGVGNNDRKRF